MKKSPLIAVAVVLALAGIAVAQERAAPQQNQGQRLREEVTMPTHGVAVLHSTEGSEVRGVIHFQQRQDGLHLRGRVIGLSPGKHGFHIHEYGDLRDPKGASAGDHFNPGGHKHGAPGDKEHHAGDLGNIEADQDGLAEVNMTAPWLKLHFVLGRGLVVHGGEDDLVSQPSGDAGDRKAVGVIGVAQPPVKRQASQ